MVPAKASFFEPSKQIRFKKCYLRAMAKHRESMGDDSPPRDPGFERRALLIFAGLCLSLAAAFLAFPGLWPALADPYEAVTVAMATIAELCRW